MDINFPLILMVATGVTGIIILIDKLFLAKRKHTDSSPNSAFAKTESFLVEQSRSFFPILLLIFSVRSFLFEPYQIPSASMEPGLIANDFILVNKFNYGLRLPVFNVELIPIGKPERGDIMVFFPPNDERNFIKRVIGLPGDIIEYKKQNLFINGKQVATQILSDLDKAAGKLEVQETIDKKTFQIQWLLGRDANTDKLYISAGPQGRWVVPDEHYFVMGDNRGNSHDGRGFGFVPKERIVGQAVALWMHWTDFLSLPSFARNKWLQ